MQNQTKVCRLCNQNKPFSEYYTQKSCKDGLKTACKDCEDELRRIKQIQKKTDAIISKGGKCTRCNLSLENSHYSVFDFHHIDPSLKEVSWTDLRYWSAEKIKTELDKCILLCANCHRIVHYSEKE